MSKNDKTLVIGFYDRDNIGDETYKLIFPDILKTENIKFACVDDLVSLDVVVVIS